MGGEIRNWGVRASIWRASRRSQQSAFVRNYVVSGKVVGVGDKDGCFFALDGRPIFSSFVSGKIGFWPAETPDLLGGTAYTSDNSSVIRDISRGKSEECNNRESRVRRLTRCRLTRLQPINVPHSARGDVEVPLVEKESRSKDSAKVENASNGVLLAYFCVKLFR